jgi:very-short-patch-repair endonuclease
VVPPAEPPDCRREIPSAARVWPYILDFYCAEHHLAVEADGEQHYSDDGEVKDRERTRYLEARGIRVLRFTNLEILREMESVLETIRRNLEELRARA